MLQHEHITEGIIKSAIEVHRVLGPGLLESAYEECLCLELGRNGLAFARQVDLPLVYKGLRLNCGYRMDIVVEESVIIEVKCVDKLAPVHEAQLLTYLRLSGKHVGFLLNFHAPVMKAGILRRVL